MGIPILSVRDDRGNIIPIPAVQGPPGQKGDTGPAGPKGDKGDTGAAGPNLINMDTPTPIAGILKGQGGKVANAVAGEDYATPAAVDTKLDAADYTRTINTATTTGAAGSFALTLDPAPAALAQGMMLLVNFHVGNDSTTVPPMLNVKGLGGNDFGAKYLFPVGQNSGKPFAAGVHIIFYDGTYWRMLDNAFLPIVGGTVYGSIVPRGALEYNLGSSGIPWHHIYASYGDFSNSLAVGGKSVWHRGNLKIAYGQIMIAPVTAGTPVSADVDYSSAGFTAPPMVFATPLTSSPQTTSVGIGNMTTTGCKVYGVRTGGTNQYSAAWLAIGT